MRSKKILIALSVVVLLGLSGCNLFQQQSDTESDGSTQVNEVRKSDLDSDDGSAIQSDNEADEIIDELEMTLEDLEKSLPEVSDDDFN